VTLRLVEAIHRFEDAGERVFSKNSREVEEPVPVELAKLIFGGQVLQTALAGAAKASVAKRKVDSGVHGFDWRSYEFSHGRFQCGGRVRAAIVSARPGATMFR